MLMSASKFLIPVIFLFLVAESFAIIALLCLSKLEVLQVSKYETLKRKIEFKLSFRVCQLGRGEKILILNFQTFGEAD